MEYNEVSEKKVSKFTIIKNTILKYKLLFIAILLFIIIAITATVLIINQVSKAHQSATIDSAVKGVKDPEESTTPEEPTYNILEELKLESGTELPNARIYFEDEVVPVTDESVIKYYLNDTEVTEASLSYTNNNIKYSRGVNKYKVVIDDKYTSSLNIVDTTSPIVSLKDVTITTKGKYEAKSFVNQYSDNSRISTFTATFKDSNQASYNKIGKYNITIVVCDTSNNCSESTAKLTIKSATQTQTPTTTEKKFVKTTVQAVKTNTEHIKYGVKKITYVDIKYNVYSDGSKTEVSRGSAYTKIDQSGFNGTVKTMRSEAASIYDEYSSTRNTILTQTNKYRAEVGARALVEDKTLSIMATIRAMEIAYSGQFSHTRPGKKEFTTMWTDYGRDYTFIGENLAKDFKSDLGACQGWRDSDGHYKNMVQTRFTKVGIGRYYFNGTTYWVQLFEE